MWQLRQMLTTASNIDMIIKNISTNLATFAFARLLDYYFVGNKVKKIDEWTVNTFNDHFYQFVRHVAGVVINSKEDGMNVKISFIHYRKALSIEVNGNDENEFVDKFNWLMHSIGFKFYTDRILKEVSPEDKVAIIEVILLSYLLDNEDRNLFDVREHELEKMQSLDCVGGTMPALLVRAFYLDTNKKEHVGDLTKIMTELCEKEELTIDTNKHRRLKELMKQRFERKNSPV